jgi:hypothetical protein
MANTRRTIYAESMENYSDSYGVSMDPLSEVLSLLKPKGYVSGGLQREQARPHSSTHATGRPLGMPSLFPSLEKAMQRRLTLQKQGTHEKLVTDRRQGEQTEACTQRRRQLPSAILTDSRSEWHHLRSLEQDNGFAVEVVIGRIRKSGTLLNGGFRLDVATTP